MDQAFRLRSATSISVQMGTGYQQSRQGLGIPGWGVQCHDRDTTIKGYEKIDRTLLNRLLRCHGPQSLQITSLPKNNVQLQLTGHESHHSYGMIRGLHFSAFVFQYYGLGH